MEHRPRPELDSPDAALRAALRLLAARSRSRQELRLALERRGFNRSQQKAVLARLDSFGYLDDSRFARQRAATLLANGFGPRAVMMRLSAQGLSEVEAQRGLLESASEIGFNELESGRAVLRKRHLDASGDPRAQARAARLLAARGFSEEVIARLVGEVALDPNRQGD